jgi:single-stranded-DNA-specific exonuclease
MKLQENFGKGAYTKEEIDPDIVGELSFSNISFELTELLKQFEPYGQGNPTPKFTSKNVKILQADSMGKEGEHLRFLFVQDGIVMPGVKFKSKELFNVGDIVTLIYTVNENTFRGNVNLQLMVDKVTV